MIRPDNNPYSNQHAVDTSSTQKTNTLSPLIEEIRMLSSQQISQFISQLFDSCDDLFYDLSNNANSNQEQTLYFSSMREVRIKRQVLQQNYVARFDESFQNIASSENINIGTTAVNNLAIVENDQIEVDVALTNMSTRANNVCYEEIYPLLIRFDSLFKGRNVDKEHNPLLPEVVCGLFADVCKAHLTISIKPLIILLKQFERFVLERMVQVYVKANQRLIEAGICPEIPRQVRKDSNIGKSDSERKEPASAVDKRATSRNRYNIPLSENSDLNFSLQAFKQLFANARSGNATLDGFRSYSNHSGPFISLSELTNLLNQAQMLVEQNSPYDVDQPHIHAVASKLLGTQSSAASGAVGESEDDTINLVAMFFEFILDDNSIALKLRNQISRLQIPILKLALQDNTFFSNQSHPARNLINIIAAVGVVYNDERELSKDKTYQKIVDVVKTICHQYGFDQQIFAELFPQLEEVVEKEQRRTTVVEKHTAQVETGKSKVKAANKTARAILIKKMHGAKLLSNARDFLIDCWLDVMVMALLKFSENSEEWSTVTRTVDDFIWCCQSDKDAEALARLQKVQLDFLPAPLRCVQLAPPNQGREERDQVQEGHLTFPRILPYPIVFSPKTVLEAIPMPRGTFLSLPPSCQECFL